VEEEEENEDDERTSTTSKHARSIQGLDHTHFSYAHGDNREYSQDG
jgi:hypothetical protein